VLAGSCEPRNPSGWTGQMKQLAHLHFPERLR
jgi:hypothetical protein